MKKFDLNIEKILENWDTYHAIRELIANAIDEQILSKTSEVKILKEDNHWLIRDYGRGLSHTHLTQNENPEKMRSTKVIGKFGIGLKDALATLDRNNIEVVILSRYGEITLAQRNKEGFDDIITLHALINEASDKNFVGTQIKIIGVDDREIEKAKKLFLRFSNEPIIESTQRGQIVRKTGRVSNIYINGVKVAEEENFLFSYNITMLNASIRKALNRERSNVGRSAYTDTVKKLLLSSTSPEVAEELGAELSNLEDGNAGDEIKWIDVQEHAVKILNQHAKYLFITSADAVNSPDLMDEAKSSGHTVIYITSHLKAKIEGSKDLSGNPIIGFSQFKQNYTDSFEFNFIEYNDLDDNEQNVYNLIPKILILFGGKPSKVKIIKISSTMRKDLSSSKETIGCWDPNSKSIVLARRLLSSTSKFSGTLIHELIHAKTGYDDVSRAFENELTDCIGRLSEMLLKIDD